MLAAPPVGGRSLYENESVLLFALLACACVLQVDLAVAGDGRSFVLAGTESTQPTASSLLTLVETEGGVGGDESNWRVHMAPAPPASMTIRWTFPPRQQGTLYQRLCARGADAVILHELRVRDLRRLVLPDAWLNDECVNELCAALAPESVVINSQLSWVVTSKIGASQSELQKRLCKWSVKLGAAQTLSLASLVKKRDRVQRVLIPWHEGKSHWILVVLELAAERVDIYDSLRQIGEPRGLRRLLRALEIHRFAVRRTKCVKQQDGFNCGVFVAAFAELVAHGLPMPSRVNAAALRTQMAQLLVERALV